MVTLSDLAVIFDGPVVIRHRANASPNKRFAATFDDVDFVDGSAIEPIYQYGATEAEARANLAKALSFRMVRIAQRMPCVPNFAYLNLPDVVSDWVAAEETNLTKLPSVASVLAWKRVASALTFAQWMQALYDFLTAKEFVVRVDGKWTTEDSGINGSLSLSDEELIKHRFSQRLLNIRSRAASSDVQYLISTSSEVKNRIIIVTYGTVGDKACLLFRPAVLLQGFEHD